MDLTMEYSPEEVDVKDGFVTMKTMWAPDSAGASEEGELTSAEMTSMLREVRDWALEEVVSLVMARILYVDERDGLFRMCVISEPPCWPVAPKMTMVLDIAEVLSLV